MKIQNQTHTFIKRTGAGETGRKFQRIVRQLVFEEMGRQQTHKHVITVRLRVVTRNVLKIRGESTRGDQF